MDAQSTQLEMLQSRLNIHGNKLWQLPFSYMGAILVVVSLVQEDGLAIEPEWIFRFAGFAGILVLWCMFGAYEGYSRTVRAINELEKDLGLTEYAKNYPSHSLPYFALVIFAMIGIVVASFL